MSRATLGRGSRVSRASLSKYIFERKEMFQVELQYDDIKGPTEIDMIRIPEFPASAALQSIEGQNLKGAAFDVLQAYADAIFRTAGDELARRAQGNALAHPTLVHPIPAPQVLAPWPLPKSPADRFRAAAHIQRHARGMATRSGLAPRAPAFAATFACEPRAACHAAPAA